MLHVLHVIVMPTFFRQALNTTTKKISLNVVLRPEEGGFPENLHRVVPVVINKRSFESFMCLDPASHSYVPTSFRSGHRVVLC